jgi:alpha-L-rhamnosidase
MKHFILEPKIPVKVESAGTEFESPYGKVKSSWKQKDGIVIWDVCVPANSSATIIFPSIGKLADVEESGKPLVKAKGIKTVAGSESSVHVSSGNYQFRFHRK